MEIDQMSLYLPLLLFLITVGFGFWVSRSGTPYPVVLFNIHKLAALAGVVLAAVRIRSGSTLGELSGWVAAGVVAIGVCVMVLFATGAVMSIREEGSGLVLFFHRAGPVVITLCVAGLILFFSVVF
jgi:hypothetical protein